MQEMADTLKIPCITIQPTEVGAQHSTCKSPLRKLLGIQDVENLSVVVATGPHIENWMDKEGHNIPNSKTGE